MTTLPRTTLLILSFYWTTAVILPQPDITLYVRYSHEGEISYGILDAETIRQLSGNLFDNPRPTGKTAPLADVKLLVPIDPLQVSKVMGVAINYNRPDQPPRQVPHPRFFAKMPTSLNPHLGDVEFPPEATNLNYEGELVFIIGKKGRHISIEDAPQYIFGVTVGNDFSENTWYGEKQGTEEPTRLISKAMDTWACLGPAIVRGVDYSAISASKYVSNGELVAQGRSRYMTLLPGDIIDTGTVAPLPSPTNAESCKPGML